MDNKKTLLVFESTNLDYATAIHDIISSGSNECILHPLDKKDNSLEEEVNKVSPTQVLILLSNNFLQDQKCIFNTIEDSKKYFLQQLTTYIVIPGILNNPFGEKKETKTQFHNAGQIVKHISYWQDVHLEERLKRRSITPEQKEAYENDVNIKRNISENIGEFLNIIRHKPCLFLDNIEHTPLVEFLIEHSIIKTYEASSKETIESPTQPDEEIDISMLNIPGLDLLSMEEKVVEDEVEVINPEEPDFQVLEDITPSEVIELNEPPTEENSPEESLDIELLKLSISDKITSLKSSSRKAIASGKITKALKDEQLIVLLDNQQIGSFFKIGQLLNILGEKEESYTVFKHILTLNPTHEDALYEAANLQFKHSKDYKDALTLVNNAIEVAASPKGRQLLLKAKILFKLNQTEIAKTTYMEACALNPTFFNKKYVKYCL